MIAESLGSSQRAENAPITMLGLKTQPQETEVAHSLRFLFQEHPSMTYLLLSEFYGFRIKALLAIKETEFFKFPGTQ